MTFMFKFNPNTPPQIESVGSPPDRHAERIVDEMLVWLHGRQVRIWERSHGALNNKQMGNPVGQERAVARLRRAVGDLALTIQLQTGKRGRYYLTMAHWMIWNVNRATIVNPLKEPPPANAWIAIGVAAQSAETGHKWENTVPMLVTRHAMVRLAQRAGVRTCDDLVKAMQDLWWALYALVVCDKMEEGKWLNPPPAGWRVELDSGAIAVIGREEGGGFRMLVKTILNPGAEQ